MLGSVFEQDCIDLCFDRIAWGSKRFWKPMGREKDEDLRKFWEFSGVYRKTEEQDLL